MGDEIIKVIEALCEKFGLAIDWTSENILPYAESLCEKIVSYRLWSSVAYIILSILLLIYAFFAIKRAFKRDEDGDLLMEYGDDSDIAIGIIALSTGLVAMIGGIIMFCINVPDIITCLTLPEKVIWDEIQMLLQ